MFEPRATKNPLPVGSGWLRAILRLGSGCVHPHRSGEQYDKYAENKGGQGGVCGLDAAKRDSPGCLRCWSDVVALGHDPLLITKDIKPDLGATHNPVWENSSNKGLERPPGRNFDPEGSVRSAVAGRQPSTRACRVVASQVHMVSHSSASKSKPFEISRLTPSPIRTPVSNRTRTRAFSPPTHSANGS